MIGGILGGDNATADATTPANADAPSDIVNIQYIHPDIVNIEFIPSDKTYSILTF